MYYRNPFIHLALAAIAASASAEPRAAYASATAAAVQAPAEATSVVAFWRAAGPALWFAKDPDFDRRFRQRFEPQHRAAARGELDHWSETPEGALALILLLDQFPRNAYRGSPQMYATDAQARRVADAAITAGLDEFVDPQLRLFVYLPFGHSEDPADQARSVALAERLGEPTASRAKHHQAIVQRFGRFPHRNGILGRAPTAEEQSYLAAGGYAG